jgi:hypothetical protein
MSGEPLYIQGICSRGPSGSAMSRAARARAGSSSSRGRRSCKQGVSISRPNSGHMAARSCVAPFTVTSR